MEHLRVDVGIQIWLMLMTGGLCTRHCKHMGDEFMVFIPPVNDSTNIVIIGPANISLKPYGELKIEITNDSSTTTSFMYLKVDQPTAAPEGLTAHNLKVLNINATKPVNVYVQSSQGGAFTALRKPAYKLLRKGFVIATTDPGPACSTYVVVVAYVDDVMINGTIRGENPHAVLEHTNKTLFKGETFYERIDRKGETFLITSKMDLSGTIIYPDKPVAVYAGVECGKSTSSVILKTIQIPVSTQQSSSYIPVSINHESFTNATFKEIRRDGARKDIGPAVEQIERRIQSSWMVVQTVKIHTLDTHGLQNSFLQTLYNMQPKFNYSLVAFKGFNTTIVIVQTKCDDCDSSFLLDQVDINGSDIIGLLNTSSTLSFQTELEPGIHFLQSPTVFRLYAYGISNTSVYSYDAPCVSRNFSVNKVQKTTENDTHASVTSKSDETSVTTESDQSAETTTSAVSSVTTEKDQSSVTTDREVSSVTMNSAEASVTTESDVSSVTKNSAEASVTTESDVSSVTTNSTEASVKTESDVSSVTMNSDETSVTTESDVSSVTKNSTEASMTTESDVSSVTMNSDETSVTTESDVSSVTKNSTEASVTTESDVSSVTTNSTEASVKTESDVSSVTMNSDETSVTTESDVSSVTKNSTEASVKTESDVSSVTKNSTEASMTTESDVTSVTMNSAETSVTTERDRSSVTTEGTTASAEIHTIHTTISTITWSTDQTPPESPSGPTSATGTITPNMNPAGTNKSEMRRICPNKSCVCRSKASPPDTRESQLAALKAHLAVDTKNIGAKFRSKNSIQDHRPLATALGCVGIIITFSPMYSSYITACQLNVGGKPEVMQVSDVYHFGETHEHLYGADKPGKSTAIFQIYDGGGLCTRHCKHMGDEFMVFIPPVNDSTNIVIIGPANISLKPYGELKIEITNDSSTTTSFMYLKVDQPTAAPEGLTAHNLKVLNINATKPVNVYVQSSQGGAFTALRKPAYKLLRKGFVIATTDPGPACSTYVVVVAYVDDVMINGTIRGENPHAVLEHTNKTLFKGETFYERIDRKGETFLITSKMDLSGTIIYPDKPVAVYAGVECGKSTSSVILKTIQIPVSTQQSSSYIPVSINHESFTNATFKEIRRDGARKDIGPAVEQIERRIQSSWMVVQTVKIHTLDTHGLQNSFLQTLYNMQPKFNYSLVAFKGFNTTIVIVQTKCDDCDSSFLLDQVDINGSDIIGLLNTSSTLSFQTELEPGIHFLQSPTVFRLYAYGISNTSVYSYDAPCVSRNFSVNKVQKTTENDTHASVTSKSDETSVTTESDQSAETTTSAVSSVTTEKDQSSVTTDREVSSMTMNSAETSVTTESDVSSVTMNSAETSVTTESDVSSVTLNSAETSMTTESDVSSVTMNSAEASVTTERDVSSVTMISAETSMTTESDVSSVTMNSAETSVTTESDVSSVTLNSAETSMTTESDVSSVTMNSAEASVTTESDVSSVTMNSAETSMTTESDVSSVTMNSAETSVTTESDVSSVTMNSAETSMTTEGTTASAEIHTIHTPISTITWSTDQTPPESPSGPTSATGTITPNMKPAGTNKSEIRRICPNKSCVCRSKASPPDTRESQLAALKAHLAVDTRNVGAKFRTKNSIQDRRPLATALGCVGIIITFSPMVIIFLLDIRKLVAAVIRLYAI